MDFTPRNDVNVARPGGQPAPARHNQKPNGKKFGWVRLARYATVLLLFSATILIIALVAAFASSNKQQQSKYVNNKELQAVFLNGGQVYFGHITGVTSQYLTLGNVYYLRVNSSQPDTSKTTTNSNDVSLVKLGCELHGPEDQMVINQEQVIFWENLKSSGQVAKAVTQFQKNNPNGQDCSQQSSASTSSTTQATPTANTPAKQ